MASVNKAIVVGHVGRDPDVRFLPSGETVAAFSVATTDKWKDKQTGELKEQTEWHRIAVFARLAEIVRDYVRKGTMLYVEGSLRTREWTDKDGIKRYTTEVRADRIQLLSSRNGDSAPQERSAPQQQQQPQQQQRRAPAASDFPDDDIPF